MSPRIIHRTAIIAGLACLLSASCSSDTPLAPEDNPLCAFACPSRGVAQGNAAVSGVPSADTYFQAVVAFATNAGNTAAAISALLSQMRADFDVPQTSELGAAVKSRGAALLGEAPRVTAGKALCWTDIARVISLLSNCDADASNESLPCSSVCKVNPGADCQAPNRTLQCTQSVVESDCSGKGKCSGTCLNTPAQNGRCYGACQGACDGFCDTWQNNKAGELVCAGRCDGKCDGLCASAVENATCTGTCTGECTQPNMPELCEGALDVRCQAGARDADCSGECAGADQFDLDIGKDECIAAARAQANYVARCDSPRVSIFSLPKDKAASDDLQRYLNGLRALEQKLPQLLALSARAEMLRTTGQSLATAANVKIKASFTRQQKAKELTVQNRLGLECASAELGRVSKAIDPPQQRLEEQLNAARNLLTALNID